MARPKDEEPAAQAARAPRRKGMDYKQAWDRLKDTIDNKIVWCEDRLVHLQSLRLRDHMEEENTKLTLHQYLELKKKMQQIENESDNS